MCERWESTGCNGMQTGAGPGANAETRTATRVIWTPWILISPVLFVFIVFFAIPVVILLASSFQRMDTGTLTVVDRLTAFNYQRFLLDEFYFGVLLLTLKISVLVTVTCAVFGYPVAAYLSVSRVKERSVLMLLILSPLLVSLVIRSFGWLIILGPRGVINALLLATGLVATPVKLIHTETAVVVGLAQVFYPFMVLAIYSALQNIDPLVVRAAHNLGAGPVRVFWRIVFPLSTPGILAGSLVVFALSVSSFVTPTILGGPWVKVMAYLAWEQHVVVLDWPFAAAISVILLAVTAIVMSAYNRLVERRWFAGVCQ
jgi:putative spermidine/putrescine transport system permease protein